MLYTRVAIGLLQYIATWFVLFFLLFLGLDSTLDRARRTLTDTGKILGQNFPRPTVAGPSSYHQGDITKSRRLLETYMQMGR